MTFDAKPVAVKDGVPPNTPTRDPTRSFQDMILTLHDFWSANGCVILQPHDMRMGAGTFHPATTLRALGPNPWNAAFVQPCRRPTDGRYGENPNRLQHYYQYQVIMKPSPDAIQDLYLASLSAIGIDPLKHDIRFVEDDWESPTLGAWGIAAYEQAVEASHIFNLLQARGVISVQERASYMGRVRDMARSSCEEYARGMTPEWEARVSGWSL